jgi:HEAT repeat protein
VWAIARTSGATASPSTPGGFSEYPQRSDKYNAAEAIAMLPGALPRPVVPGKLVTDHADDIARGLTDALAEHRDVVVAVLADLDSAPQQLGLGALTPTTTDAKVSAALATIAIAISPAITSQLTSEDPKVRALAVSVLAKLDGGKVHGAEDAIARGLTDPADQVRAAAMNAIATLAVRRGSAPPALVATLTRTLAATANVSWADRRVAALALGHLGALGSPEPLVKAASDPSSFVREAVALSLGTVAASAGLAPLLALSRDEVPQVRAAAARSLAGSKDDRAVRRRGELATDPDPTVRAAATAP